MMLELLRRSLLLIILVRTCWTAREVYLPLPTLGTYLNHAFPFSLSSLKMFSKPRKFEEVITRY